jgi:hypothetical protein
MPIIGMNFKSIKANINEGKITKNVNVNSSPVIEKMEKKEINMPGIKDVLSIKFKFTTNYEPKIGEIMFEGEVLYNSEDMKEILKKWEKDKKIDDPLAMEVLNAIFRRCLTKGIDIASELGLPPPIRFPIVKPKEQSEYIG